MADYLAGNLQLDVLGSSTTAIKSINDTVKSLNALSRAIAKINNTQFVFAGQKIEHIFTKIASATKLVDTKNLEALASTAKSLSSISRIGNLERTDFNKIGKGFNNLAVAITPFINKVRSAEASLTSLYGVLQRTSGKKIQNLLGTTNERGGFGLLNVAKWGISIYSARRLGTIVGKIARQGADYTETLNLWETAMGSNITLATEFVNKMNEAYGISEKTLMNAQAIFKNMLGSLGQISDTTAYALSEGITQMAIDYASLYNVSFEKAFSKFQAVLAGQVRPIRSVSGYDITETTLFELYKSLGGEKAMRQLNRTEKQLLSILAVFNQMTASGAIGDLQKTMESFANQIRVMAEAWQQIKTYAGVLLTYTIQESGLFTKFNAILLFIGDALKALAQDMDAIVSFGGDIFGGTTDSANDASDAIDKVQGKLLDFDKFRAMNQADDSPIGLDTTLLDALTRYSSVVDGYVSDARNLANQWLKAFGIVRDTNGELVASDEALTKVKTTLKLVGTAIALLFGLGITASLVKVGTFLNTYAIKPLLLVITNLPKLLTHIKNIGFYVQYFGTTVLAPFFSSIKGIATAFVVLTAGVISFINAWGDMTWGHRIVTIVGAITAGVIGLVIALKALKFTVAGALALGATLAGGVLLISSQFAKNSVSKFAEGGMPDKGTMFVAGEAGAEIVYNTPSGQSGVANVQQIAQATYSGTMQALNNWWGGNNARRDIPQLKNATATGMYEVVKSEARRRGDW